MYDCISLSYCKSLTYQIFSTFFRRPGFSPDGKLVAYPCGCYELENDDPQTASGLNSTDSDDKMIQINVVYVFQTKDLEK